MCWHISVNSHIKFHQKSFHCSWFVTCDRQDKANKHVFTNLSYKHNWTYLFMRSPKLDYLSHIWRNLFQNVRYFLVTKTDYYCYHKQQAFLISDYDWLQTVHIEIILKYTSYTARKQTPHNKWKPQWQSLTFMMDSTHRNNLKNKHCILLISKHPTTNRSCSDDPWISWSQELKVHF
jgi:hypothetical protein